MRYKTHSIGKVTLHTPTQMHSDHYSDKAEDALLKLFKKEDFEAKRREILADSPPWHMYYHLNYKRANLLRWYNFKKDSRILEIGAGCGSITETLVENNAYITALELTEKRATINAYRNKKSENLEVVVDNMQQYKPDIKFDYVICVGVLEYAGKFYHTDTPYQDFLKKIRSYLKPGGTLLLAIENRLGLKYWNGAGEDHIHKLFEGLNSYTLPKGVQTFGKEELNNLLLSCGFKDSYFFYPFPDYKTPSIIYSDDYYPGNGCEFPLGLLPTPTLDQKRLQLFSEQTAMIHLEANKLFPHFSNSFLVEVRA